ncbi:MAG: ABC transporter substrate-binding protein [Clostridiales bacterium]|jgi:branched-chain amino acid transport system substrate-binding protein|nr:ABC transporter substrate-binding protein [Clostridiales bacterium]
MKKRRVLSLVSAAVMLTGIVAGCKSKEDDKIIIGGLAPLTGNVAQYGQAVDNAVKMAIEEINEKGGILGKKIDYRSVDEKGDPTEAVNAYYSLVEEGIVALIGDVTSKPSKSVAQKAAEDNMPMITPSGSEESITKVGKNVFRTCFIDPYQGKLMADYAFKKLNAKSAAILFDTGDPYSTGIADAFDAAAKELGMTVTNKEGYASGSTDFKTQLTKIQGSKPDVLLLPVYYNDVALIAVQAKQIGITAKLLGGDGWAGVQNQLDEKNMDVLANSYFCNQYDPTSSDPDMQNFLKKYKERYKTDPIMFAVLGYDTAYILTAAIERAGSTDPDKIIEELKKTDYDGLTGKTVFNENRNPVRLAYITTFEGKKEKVLESYSVD